MMVGLTFPEICQAPERILFWLSLTMKRAFCAIVVSLNGHGVSQPILLEANNLVSVVIFHYATILNLEIYKARVKGHCHVARMLQAS